MQRHLCSLADYKKKINKEMKKVKKYIAFPAEKR